MSSDRILDSFLDYLEAFEMDLQRDYLNASSDIRPFIGGRLDVLEEIIDYAENNLGLIVRQNYDPFPFETFKEEDNDEG